MGIPLANMAVSWFGGQHGTPPIKATYNVAIFRQLNWLYYITIYCTLSYNIPIEILLRTWLQ